MNKFLFVALHLLLSSVVLFAQMNDANKLELRNQLLNDNLTGKIDQALKDVANGKQPSGEFSFAPIKEGESKVKSYTSRSIYGYDTYITNDLVGTAGNGVRDQLMVATPVNISFCQRSDAGTPVKELKEGILFISSDTFKSNMNAKPYPLGLYEFRNVFSPYSNTSIKNAIPFSTNYQYATPMYMVYYHSYLPVQMATLALITDGNSFYENSGNQSQIIGCYSLRYDGQTSNAEYYWLSLHKTQILKDTFFVLQTVHQRNMLAGFEYNSFLHIVRQGIDTNWQPYIDALFGK